MRRQVVIAASAVILFLMVSGAPSFAASAAPVQECSPTTTGSTLVNGVCVMAGAVPGADDYYQYINADNNDAADRFTIASGSLPPGLTMPSYLGVADTVIEGDPTEAGTFTFVVHAADPDNGLSSNQTYSITSELLVCSNGDMLTGSVCVLPGAAVGQQYEEAFAYGSSGGGLSVTGTLPPGVSTSGTEVVGTPSQQGTFTFTVTESTQVGPPLQQTYSIAVGPPLPLTDTTGGSPPGAGTVDTIYSATFSASGGEAPYTWSLVSGQLPPGLELASSDPPAQIDNEAAGTPTTVGTYVFTMKVTDTLGDTAQWPGQHHHRPDTTLEDQRGQARAARRVRSAPPIPPSHSAPPAARCPTPGPSEPDKFRPAWPSGLPNPMGSVSPPATSTSPALPTKRGTFNFTMKVTDNLGDTASQACSITIKT